MLAKRGGKMNSISNDFVTIEFKNDKEEKIAQKAIELFNSQKTLYKELLNGKETINVDIFPNNISDFLDNSNELRFCIISSLLSENNYINHVFFEKSSNIDMYFNMLRFLNESYDEVNKKSLYYELANDYFYLTDDFTYLKKYLYDDINRDDLFIISRYLLKNHYDSFFKGKIEFDINELKRLKINKNEFIEIMSIMDTYRKELLSYDNFTKIINELQNTYNEYNKNIPLIDDNEFENLVTETLVYIDPTNNLLKEYLECKENGVIEEAEENATDYNYFTKKDNNLKIVIKRSGNIEDVITLVHEFAHYHYSKDNSLGILSEYPSIYYELKTSEYLIKKGYSLEEIKKANSFRLINNIDIITKSFPQLYSIVNNMDKDIEDYDDNFFNRIDEEKFKVQLQQQFPKATKEDIDTLKEVAISNYKIQLLVPITNDMAAFKYIVGSYFANDAIDFLEHEETLKILDRIKTESPSIEEVITMHHMDSNTKNEELSKTTKILKK